jgi:hypothetical protein
MSEPNNGQNDQPLRPQTKAEIVAQREQVRMLGIALGNWREAARQCGLSEGRVLNWVVRYRWKLPKRIEAPHPREMLSPVVTPAQSLEERLKHDAEATRVGLSTATRKASVSLAERDGDQVVNVSARLKDVVSREFESHPLCHTWAFDVRCSFSRRTCAVKAAQTNPRTAAQTTSDR